MLCFVVASCGLCVLMAGVGGSALGEDAPTFSQASGVFCDILPESSFFPSWSSFLEAVYDSFKLSI